MSTKQRHLSKAQKVKAKATFVEAMKKSGGILKDACEKTGIARQTIYDWRQADPDFDAACQETQELMLDEAESKLMAAVRRGNLKAIKFFLERKGRSRGYDLHQDIDLTATVLRPRVVFEGDENDAVQDQ
jgi:hypothetical protein